ncbi:MAG: BREX-1 system adenine-specific DNA-methyltransferase PglX, partial [Nitrosomonas halophila]
METAKLKKFAQFARCSLLEQVSAKLKLVLAENSAARRERAEAIKKLEEAIRGHGKEQVIERVAYIWFNRFCALRFMDVNRYTRIDVVSPAEGQFQPEILAEAKMGHIDEEMVHNKVRQQIFALLDGKAPSRDPQGEAYRLLVVAACNFFHRAMPFLFQRIDDYTELLMPDDLLSGNAILAYTREAMTPDACEDVEVIGWLYQFYISEKKDEVFDGLKKNKKITPENIPAATQLFTPHWIVKYLVENSLGRLWMLNRPNSLLKERMEYYIEPQEDLTTEHTENTEGEKQDNKNSVSSVYSVVEKDFLVVNSPEDIKICDPACGSGHMLTYAFDLLYAIYEEEGYDPAEIPEKILTNNLYGIEIDERAGELAAFALTMKARAKQRRFFNKSVKPNICVLQNIHFDEDELKEYMDFIGYDLFTAPLQATLRQFEEADNFGSLIRPDVTDVDNMRSYLKLKNVSGHLFLSKTHEKVLQALQQADYLSPKYHVVIANPPYMGLRNMSARMSSWLKENYSDTKTDLFASFVMRAPELCIDGALIGIMSPNVWMYISTHEKLRAYILKEATLTNLVELPLTGFKGATVQICAYNFIKRRTQNYSGSYVSLVQLKGGDYEMSENAKSFIANKNSENHFLASSKNFRKIPGMPIAYWVSQQLVECFSSAEKMADFTPPRKGIDTGNNDQFLRFWYEVSQNDVNFVFDKDDEDASRKWFRYNKGGEYRKWFGNNEYVVNWKDNGSAIRSYFRSTIRNDSYLGSNSLTWSDITSSRFSARYSG